VFAKPQLEIFADDVKCSHGATIGQLDEEPIFYLRSRGLDLNTARMLLIQAFASEVLMKIEHPAIHAWVEEKVLNRMDLMLAENKA
jgi:Fe-S cluster assembly protein SufD